MSRLCDGRCSVAGQRASHWYVFLPVQDLYDCVKYDAIHNGRLKLQAAPELFVVAKQLADFVIPQEYGVSQDSKLEAARKIGETAEMCRLPLLPLIGGICDSP